MFHHYNNLIMCTAMRVGFSRSIWFCSYFPFYVLLSVFLITFGGGGGMMASHFGTILQRSSWWLYLGAQGSGYRVRGSILMVTCRMVRGALCSNIYLSLTTIPHYDYLLRSIWQRKNILSEYIIWDIVAHWTKKNLIKRRAKQQCLRFHSIACSMCFSGKTAG